MPATFAHCLIARKSIDKFAAAIKSKYKNKTPEFKVVGQYAKYLLEKNSFVVMGSAGPDYPYLSDILTTGVLKISHNWANRMHYENVSTFINKGIVQLIGMDDKSDSFDKTLAWYCGYVSHVLADSFLHPVVNSIVEGTYMFTSKEHGQCELLQDIYIFKRETEEDIVSSNPRNGPFGFLKILDECSDPDDDERIHPAIRTYWSDLLKAAHPNASNYYNGIDPDKWHYNYKGRVNFVVDPGAIFRHVSGMTGFTYKKADDITVEERTKYIDKILLPNKKTSNYDEIFDKTIDKVVETWLLIIECLIQKSPDKISNHINNWNLDTGVDESKIDLWPLEV